MSSDPSTVSGIPCDAACRSRTRLILCVCSAGLAGVAGYVAIAGWYGNDVSQGDGLSAPAILAIVCLTFVASLVVLGKAEKRGRFAREVIGGLALALPVSLFGLVCFDAAFAMYIERSAPPPPPDDRDFGGFLAGGEFYPPLYYPTQRNFRLHKPGVSVTFRHYGDYFATAMLQSKTLRTEVLSLKQVDITIDENGLRENRPFKGARIAALGDSFTFGWAMSAERGWVGQLERRLGERVVNLGAHDSSPKQELELIKYFVDKQGNDLPLKLLVWQIYEGNDLEDSYEDIAPAHRPRKWKRGFVPLLDGIFATLKDNMAVEQFRLHRADFGGAPASRADRHLVVDGVPQEVPSFHSDSLGTSAFLAYHLEQAGRPLSYVMEHENRPRLDDTFAEMARFSRERGFRVIVVLVPTSARLHGHHFDDFPALSEAPHFLDHVSALAAKHGMERVNLLDLFAEKAGTKLLHFRDDDHWNEDGHALAAEVIARHIRGMDTR